ncbi:MAG TPA: hypothetical protein DGT23_28170 [Micromonosporaceae bacterium]|nr:hypothetical protein [Micromonosporaceae bacterium]
MGQRDVLIFETSVEVTTAHAAARYDVSLLTAVVEGRLGWLLSADGNAGTIVPREAITAEQAEAMTAFAAHHGNAKP